MTEKSSHKISNNLDLKGVEKRFFSHLVSYQNCRSPIKRELLFRKLLDLKSKQISSESSRTELEFFSEWYHVVIYELAWQKEFRSDPKWISDQLQPRIRVDEVRKSLTVLKNLGLLVEDSMTKILKPSKFRITTGDEIASVAVIRYHQKMIELGRESITRVNDQLRDISSIAISISSQQLVEFKHEISHFRKKILALAESNKVPGDFVYQMNIQLFPVSNSIRRLASDEIS